MATRALAASLAVFTFWGVSPAHGDPADIFSIGAPTIGSEPPKAADIQVGDARVSTQTGALEYGYPIDVPPGRNGMQPHLALAYSSTAPIYGGVANGWSLPIPAITEDTSAGRLWEQDPDLGTTRYVSSMAGGHPLIVISEARGADAVATYRAKNDSSFTRYERLSGAADGSLWRARTTDGNVYTFAAPGHVDGSFTNGGPCTTISLSNAPLTHEEDAFGNAIDYYYEVGVFGECRIAAITWGQNSNASIVDFARLRFNYSVPAVPQGCPAGTLVGAQQSYRTGQLIVTGASELDSIVATAYAPGQVTAPVHTRTITLSYAPDVNSGIEQTASCASTHAAYRSLYSIQESAVNTDDLPIVSLPAIKFAYGSAQFGTGALSWAPQANQPNPWSSAVSPSPGANFNLGWGYRFNKPTWPTVEAMMLDVDGDGLVDRVVSAPYTAPSDNRYHCRAQWYKNLGNLHFDMQTPRYVSLPTLKWATQNASCDPNNPSAAFAGSLQPNTHNAYDGESCSLNYQRTTYFNTEASDFIGCQTSTCPNGYCDDPQAPDYGKTCGATPSPSPTYLAYRWFDADGDGLIDLIASPSMGSVYDLLQGTGVGLGCQPGVQEPEILGQRSQYPQCPTTPYGIQPPQKAYTRCGNMYPWMIYRNKGNGSFGVPSGDPTTPYPDKIVYQPTPLESDSGDSSLTSLPVGATHGTFDLDGDGIVDGVDASDASGSGYWGAYRNDGSGGLVPTTSGGSFSFDSLYQSISDTSYTPATGPSGTATGSAESSAGMFDLNGDGLADHWTTNQLQGPPTFNLNIGTGFFPVASSQIRPGNDGQEGCYGGCASQTNLAHDARTGFTYTNSVFLEEAQRTDTSRVLDVDDDGRPDVVQTIPGTSTLGGYLNEGGVINPQPVATPGAPADVSSILHKIVAMYSLTYGLLDQGPYTWELRSDVLDLDGDGIPEGVSFADHSNNGAAVTITKIPTPPEPPRLLVGIDNGRGASSAITYASMSDAIVTRDLGVTMPRTGWVVKAIATTDAVPTSVTSTTSYAYHNPHFSVEGDLLRATIDGSDPSLPTVWGPSKIASFRGFEQVTTTRPSGAQDVDTFDYGVDWSGRLVKHVVVPAEQPVPNVVSVASVDLTTWEWLPLFCDFGQCSLKTYHAAVQEHYTCGAGVSEAACESATDNYTRTTTDYAVQGNSLWAPTRSVLSSSHSSTPSSPANSDRVTDTAYLTVADSTHYWIHTASEMRSSVSTGGALTPFATNVYTYDSSNRVPTKDDVYLLQSPRSGHPEDHAYTTRVYDLATGNLLQRRKPAQEAANGPYLTYRYDDPRKLYPTSEVDELGNELDYVYEYGTGTKLDTQGPNVAYCTVTNTCPDGSVPKQSVRIRVDGLGRTVEKYETVSSNGTVYTPSKTQIASYDDTSIPNSTTQQQAYGSSNGSNIYTKTTTTLDGHGRPSRRTDYVFGSAPTDAITTWQYGSDGTLQTVTVPDPSANGTATVAYTYGYDSLGRPTSIRRPDTSVLTDRSGVDISYDGLVTTTTEVVKSGDGNAATMRATKDAFGRLVMVDELANSPLTWATTTYTYDPADRVTQVNAPENVTTAIQYDFAGRRTDVVRQGGTWHFTFDQNNNVSTLTTPHTCAPGDACDARYVTSYVYDALDRVTSKFLAHRELSDADLTLFAADKETFIWDYGVPGHTGNYKGQLIYWRSFGPNTSTATQQRQVQYDAQGNDYLITDTSSAVGISLQRQYLTTYTLHGQLSFVRYDDWVGGTNSTNATFIYDARGLPQSVTLTRGGVTNSQAISVQTRNVGGLVTKRRTDQPGAAMTFVESNWTYDPLGRVTGQLVQMGPGPTRVAEQDLSYLGNDDPKTLDEYLGSNHKQFAYDYDQRHELTGVNETTTGGAYFNASYSFGPAGRFLTASEHSTAPGPGSEIVPHDVTYEYGGQDPEQVTALLSGSTPFYGYAYDAAGNQTRRCSGGYPDACTGESIDYLYDGDDRLRRATKKLNGITQGSEEYWYTHDGHRVETVRHDAAGAPTEIVDWLRDSEAHYDGAGTLQNVYSYVSLGTPVARVNRTGNTTASLEYDFQGLGSSTLAAVDSSGLVNASFSYSPFGTQLETTDAGGSSNGVSTHPRRFNDKYVDSITALTYYGARYYDRTSLTWTQPDPLFKFRPDAGWASPRNANLYAFSLNNTNRYFDPDGRLSIPWEIDWDAVKTAAVAVGTAVVEGAISLTPPGAVVVVVGTAVGTGVAVSSTSGSEEATTEGTGRGSRDLPPPTGGEAGEPTTPPKLPRTGFSPTPPVSTGDSAPKHVGGNDRTVDEGEAPAKEEPLTPDPPGPPGSQPSLPPRVYKLPKKPPAPGKNDPPPARVRRKWWQFWSAGQSSEDNANQSAPKPADANGDGHVTDEEESQWSREAQ